MPSLFAMSYIRTGILLFLPIGPPKFHGFNMQTLYPLISSLHAISPQCP
jgi:hypothetical protein